RAAVTPSRTPETRAFCSVCTTERRTVRTVPAGVVPARAGAARRWAASRQARAHVTRFVAGPPVVVRGGLGLAPHGHRHRGVEDDTDRDQSGRDPARDHRAPPR